MESQGSLGYHDTFFAISMDSCCPYDYLFGIPSDPVIPLLEMIGFPGALSFLFLESDFLLEKHVGPLIVNASRSPPRPLAARQLDSTSKPHIQCIFRLCWHILPGLWAPRANPQLILEVWGSKWAPDWSTWAQQGCYVEQSRVLELAGNQHFEVRE